MFCLHVLFQGAMNCIFTFYPEGIISFPSIMKKPFLDYQEYSAKKKQVQINLA